MQPELLKISSMAGEDSNPVNENVLTGVDANADLPCSPPSKDDIPSTQTPGSRCCSLIFIFTVVLVCLL